MFGGSVFGMILAYAILAVFVASLIAVYFAYSPYHKELRRIHREVKLARAHWSANASLADMELR